MCNSKKAHEKCPIDGSILIEIEAVATSYFDDGVLNYQFQCTVVYVFGQMHISTPENTRKWLLSPISSNRTIHLFKL